MEKYIFTFEDGEHFIGDKYTETDLEAVQEGMLSIIRCSDGKNLIDVNTWVELPKWEN